VVNETANVPFLVFEYQDQTRYSLISRTLRT
jgi:hypothetical protein